jgi:hypothetical protein
VAPDPSLVMSVSQLASLTDEVSEIRKSLEEVRHYIIQPLVELYGDCMVVLKVS